MTATGEGEGGPRERDLGVEPVAAALRGSVLVALPMGVFVWAMGLLPDPLYRWLPDSLVWAIEGWSLGPPHFAVALLFGLGSMAARLVVRRLSLQAFGPSSLRWDGERVEWRARGRVVVAMRLAEAHARLLTVQELGQTAPGWKSPRVGRVLQLASPGGDTITLWAGRRTLAGLRHTRTRLAEADLDDLRARLRDAGAVFDPEAPRADGVLGDPGRPWLALAALATVVGTVGFRFQGFAWPWKACALVAVVLWGLRVVAPLRRLRALWPAAASRVPVTLVEGGPERVVVRRDDGARLTLDLDDVRCPDAFVHEREGAPLAVELVEGEGARGPYRGGDAARARSIAIPALDSLRGHLRTATLVDLLAMGAFVHVVWWTLHVPY